MSPRYLVAVDLSELSKRAIAYAVRLAEGVDCKVDLLHVLSTRNTPHGVGHPAAKEIFEQVANNEEHVARKQLTELANIHLPASVRGELIIDRGPAAQVIVDRAVAYEMVVLSTHGRTGLSAMFLGSVAERVVRSAPGPVLVVR
jgi:universal stress protein A